ncbi:hypothetical protein GGR54DRAFT_262619 [Hypoxylon sp. NC1633]|nr:hypothetical protein GGR54DRAFT_262619 [Hypoxylon sp. NC1633]
MSNQNQRAWSGDQRPKMYRRATTSQPESNQSYYPFVHSPQNQTSGQLGGRIASNTGVPSSFAPISTTLPSISGVLNQATALTRPLPHPSLGNWNVDSNTERFPVSMPSSLQYQPKNSMYTPRTNLRRGNRLTLDDQLPSDMTGSLSDEWIAHQHVEPDETMLPSFALPIIQQQPFQTTQGPADPVNHLTPPFKSSTNNDVSNDELGRDNLGNTLGQQLDKANPTNTDPASAHGLSTPRPVAARSSVTKPKWRKGMKERKITDAMTPEEREEAIKHNIHCAEAKTEHNREANRESARRSRAKKQAELVGAKKLAAELQHRNAALLEHNNRLLQENMQLRQEVTQLRSQRSSFFAGIGAGNQAVQDDYPQVLQPQQALGPQLNMAAINPESQSHPVPARNQTPALAAASSTTQKTSPHQQLSHETVGGVDFENGLDFLSPSMISTLGSWSSPNGGLE